MVKEEIRNGKYGVQSRVGNRFHKEIEDIKDKRLRNGKSSDRESIVNVTNAIIRHKHWEKIKIDLIELEEEELKNLGKK